MATPAVAVNSNPGPGSATPAERVTADGGAGWITNKPQPSWIDASSWAEFAGPTQSPWIPTGSTVAGTAFQPQRDGFFYFNYGNNGTAFPNVLNNYIFGTSQGPVTNLRIPQMIELFGRAAVCMRPGGVVPRGDIRRPCHLTPAAQAWLLAMNRGMEGGHCFGMATIAAQLFNGQLPRGALGGDGRTISIPFDPRATGQIAERFAMQTLVQQTPLKPSQAVALLRRNLRPGRTPYTMAITSNGGEGHAITPIALRNKGAGQYDIAVYDNNYPSRVRAVHADTVNEKFDYLLFSSPGQPPETMAGLQGLIPTSQLMGRFPAPFLASANQTLLVMGVGPTQTRVSATVRAPGGGAIPGLVVVPPTNPWRPGLAQQLPTFKVPKGVPFELTLTNAGGATVQPWLMMTNGEVQFQIPGGAYQMKAHSIDTMRLTPRFGRLDFRTGKGSLVYPAASDLIQTSSEYWVQVGSNAMSPGGTWSIAMDEARRRFTYRATGAARTAPQFMLGQTYNGTDGPRRNTSALTGFSLAQGGQLLWRYGDWPLGQRGTTLVKTAPGIPPQTIVVPTTVQPLP
jgi:hypothetical protein